MEQREARRLARQQAQADISTAWMQHRHKLMKRCEESSCCCCASKSESEKSRRLKGETIAINETQSAVRKTDENPTALDPKKLL